MRHSLALTVISNSLFPRLSDVASGLPPYEGQVLLSSMDRETDAKGLSQQGAYDQVYKPCGPPWHRRWRRAPSGCWRCWPTPTAARGARRSSTRPRASPSCRSRHSPRSGSTPRRSPRRPRGGGAEGGTPRASVRHAHGGAGHHREHGRHPDLARLYGGGDEAEAVAPERQEASVADKVKEGVDVLVRHPRLVQTSLDLVDFPIIVWFETDYSDYTMRQASRR